MSELTDLSATPITTWFVLNVIGPNAPAPAKADGFAADIDDIAEMYSAQMDNLATREDVDVSTAKSDLASLAAAVKAGAIEAPAAAA